MFYGIRRAMVVNLCSIYVEFSALDFTQTKNSFHEFASLGAHQAADPEYFSPAHRKAHILEGMGTYAGQPLDSQIIFAPGLVRLGRKAVIHLPAHHPAYNRIRCHLLCRPGSHQLSVSHNGNFIGNLKNLINFVGDVNHCGALLFKLPDDFK